MTQPQFEFMIANIDQPLDGRELINAVRRAIETELDRQSESVPDVHLKGSAHFKG